MSTHPSSPQAPTPDRELIERRAFEIWDQSGRPEGLADEHWRQAEQELQQAAHSVQKEAGRSSSGFENSWQGGTAEEQQGTKDRAPKSPDSRKSRR